jgi:hypothetical protein
MICIYCTRNDTEVKFNREHIIPKNIGGTLFLDNFVCESCNSYLGTNIDTEILRLPDTLEAFKILGIPHNKHGILRFFYTIKCKLENYTISARIGPNGFEIIDQELLDGSILVSEKDLESKLKKIIHRDNRLKNAGIIPVQIDAEIAKLIELYKISKPGDRVSWPSLGIALLKRNDKPIFTVEPVPKINIERLISKIAFEFFFFVSAHTASNNLQFIEPLYHQIRTGENQKDIFITRMQSQSKTFKPYHAISFETFGGHTRVEVVFFGHIIYCLIGPRISDLTFKEISKKCKCSNIIGILYEQDLFPKKKKIGLLLNDGSIKGIITI